MDLHDDLFGRDDPRQIDLMCFWVEVGKLEFSPPELEPLYVLHERYSTNGEVWATYGQVGQRLGISPGRAKWLVTRALCYMCHPERTVRYTYREEVIYENQAGPGQPQPNQRRPGVGAQSDVC